MRLRPALVNGAAGVVVTADGRPVTVIGFTIADGKIVEIDAISDSQRLPTIAAALLANGSTRRLPGQPPPSGEIPMPTLTSSIKSEDGAKGNQSGWS
jgi:hypothetical protein